MIKPIKRIVQSPKDIQYGDQNCRPKSQEKQPENYHNRVVIKPWGHEFLAYENDYVAIWFLHIRKDHATSMHSHPSKRTCLTLLSGKALCNTFNCRSFLNPGDALIIEQAVFHSTKALSLDGIGLLEVETPPGKLDLLRLEDNYGRQDFGYEGCSEMITENLNDYKYFRLKEMNSKSKDHLYRNGDYCIDMEQFSSQKEFRENFVSEPGSLYCICQGSLRSVPTGEYIKTGEIQKGGYLQQIGPLEAAGETLLLRCQIYC
jgi:mannose-6-phosphate isomerase-like protein (cupin superfamily)